jgi:hypothetical protein
MCLMWGFFGHSEFVGLSVVDISLETDTNRSEFSVLYTVSLVTYEHFHRWLYTTSVSFFYP